MRDIFEAVVIHNGRATEPYKFAREETRDAFANEVRAQGFEVRTDRSLLLTTVRRAMQAWTFVDLPRLNKVQSK